MVQVKNLHKTYVSGTEMFEALKGVDLEIKDGESLAIVGKSGSGKSTLMHIMAGLDTPTVGEVVYDGKSLKEYKEDEMSKFRNENVGFVFQQFFLQPNMTVFENVKVPLKVRGMKDAEAKEKVENALKEVGLTDKSNNKATDLSGGQKQRVCIARAIVVEPKVIFADEPTGNLDTENGKIVTEMLFRLNKEKGITLIIVTHDEDLAALCSRKIYIRDGKAENK